MTVLWGPVQIGLQICMVSAVPPCEKNKGVIGECPQHGVFFFIFQNMMIVLDPNIAGKAGGLSEHHCTANRCRSRDIAEAKGEEEVGEVEELVPDPDLTTMMGISQ